MSNCLSTKQSLHWEFALLESIVFAESFSVKFFGISPAGGYELCAMIAESYYIDKLLVLQLE